MKNAAVLFFGGENVTVTLASEGVNGTYVTRSRATRPYSGIVGGEFVNPDELRRVFADCMSECFRTARSFHTDKIYVAVPPCFCEVGVTGAEKTFEKPKKITARDVQTLLDGGRAIYFKIDGGAPLIDATGYTAYRLQAQVSHLNISQLFMKQVTSALSGKKFKFVEFVPTALAEGIYLIDEDVRDRTCVLVSCGLTTTAVSVITGDELVMIETFEVGMAHVINDVSIVMKTGYQDAVAMVANPTAKVADIVIARLEDMAERIFDFLNQTDKKLFKKPFYICGGYTDAIDGAREVFEKALNVEITQTICPFTEQNPADTLTNDAVISYALKKQN